MYDVDQTIEKLQAEYETRTMIIECLKMVITLFVVAALILGFAKWAIL